MNRVSLSSNHVEETRDGATAQKREFIFLTGVASLILYWFLGGKECKVDGIKHIYLRSNRT